MNIKSLSVACVLWFGIVGYAFGVDYSNTTVHASAVTTLRNANLTNATLIGDFSAISFVNAQLYGADLTQASLGTSSLSSRFDGAKCNANTKFKEGSGFYCGADSKIHHN